jgi:hypothetical protein
MDYQALGRLRRALLERRLDPEHLDPWEAWKTFKDFVRAVECATSEVIFVGLGIEHQDDQFWHLTFVRELEHVDPSLPPGPFLREEHFDREPPEPEPLWDVVCDLSYARAAKFTAVIKEYASADYDSLEQLFAAVEGDLTFQAAMDTQPVASTVYEEEAC